MSVIEDLMTKHASAVGRAYKKWADSINNDEKTKQRIDAYITLGAQLKATEELHDKFNEEVSTKYSDALYDGAKSIRPTDDLFGNSKLSSRLQTFKNRYWNDIYTGLIDMSKMTLYNVKKYVFVGLSAAQRVVLEKYYKSISSLKQKSMMTMLKSKIKSMINRRSSVIGDTESANAINMSRWDLAIGNFSKKTWRTMEDNRVRDSHVSVANVEKFMNEVFVTSRGNEMFCPHDDNAPTDEIVGCRCWLDFS